MSLLKGGRCLTRRRSCVPQGDSARSRREGPAVQRDPQEEKGEEGEKAAEERRRLQPSWAHVLHTQQ